MYHPFNRPCSLDLFHSTTFVTVLSSFQSLYNDVKTGETCYHPACDITLDKQSEKRSSGAEETKCCRKVKKRGESRASGGPECGIARRDCCRADDGIVRCEHGTVVTDRSGSGVSTTGSFQDIQIVLMSLSPLCEESSGSIKATTPPP